MIDPQTSPDRADDRSPDAAPAPGTRPSRRTPPTRAIATLLAIAAFAAAVVIGIASLRPATSPASTDIATGQAVPNVAGPTLDGGAFDLAALRGRPVIINFWGPSCVPCRTEFPLLAAKAAAHAAEGLVIVGVLTDDPVEPAREFAARYGGTWPTVIDPGGAIRTAYRVIARPQSYFVDRAGVLRSIQIGEVREADFERQYAAISGGG
ncbi:MAG TPA: TlpA disulfide reductase family protein [Patescibacteria group bacterium]|nr:TlpA disulfide reductase family protein [Patescibacteria group bacterium]